MPKKGSKKCKICHDYFMPEDNHAHISMTFQDLYDRLSGMSADLARWYKEWKQ